MIDNKEKMLQQHHLQYKNVLLFVIESNTVNFYEQGLLSLFVKPPLASMDLLKQKAISLAKDNFFVINTDLVDGILDAFRSSVSLEVKAISNLRQKELEKLLEEINDKNVNNKVIKFTKKQLKDIDKKLKNLFKDIVTKSLNKNLFINTSSVFNNSDSVNDIFQNYVLKKYFQTLLSQFDSVLAIRNNTFLNAINEQGHRYLFTKKNSHLFD